MLDKYPSTRPNAKLIPVYKAYQIFLRYEFAFGTEYMVLSLKMNLMLLDLIMISRRITPY